MECPGITNLRTTQNEFKNNEEENVRELPNSEQVVRTKVTTVNIQREDGSLGITLRGGFHQNTNLSRPVVITYLKPDGPAAREGTIKPNDRLLAVDGVSLEGSSLNEAQTLLRQPSATTLLTIEYDVNVLDSVEHASGPLLVEIERSSGQQLGLTLVQNENGVVVERVKPGSLADRCGALHVGDEILAVNATRVDRGSVSLEDIMRILECECPLVRLEILPTFAAVSYPNYGTWRTKGTMRGKSSRKEIENGVDYKGNHINPHGFCGTEIALTHCETLHTTLTREDGDFGLQFVQAPDGNILINSITPGGPAERSQCLHPGDRLLAINHRSVTLDNLTANDINDLLEGSCTKLSLHTEFDVLDTVVPASGVFTVKLVKRGGAGLGITITASKPSGFVVCEMKKGSIAHRAGSLVPGDKLLAINNIPLDQCSVEYAAHILHQSSDIVTLKVQREDNTEMTNSRKITYTVDLERYGGPIGITIAGSEEPLHPITISGLTAGGLAEQTGMIHIGDEILAINNHALYGEPLSKAHSLLQNSTDLVTLKLSRSILPVCRVPNRGSPILPSSIDSAVESWDSSRLDLTSSPDHQKIPKDPRDYIKSNTQQWSSQCSTFRSPAMEKPQQSGTQINPDNFDLAILDEITSENLKIKQELDLLSIKLNEQRKSELQEEENTNNTTLDESNGKSETPDVGQTKMEEGKQEEGKVIYTEVNHYNKNLDYNPRESSLTNDFEHFEMMFMPDTKNWCKNQYFGNDSNQHSIRSEFQFSQLYEVTLYKDPVYEDFGFSVSDGLYERGVFINRIRKGGPADVSNVLKPYDRILQVNETYTQDFDCCLTVPLIASAGDSLVLLVARNYTNCNSENEASGSDKIQSQRMLTNLLRSNSHEEMQRILV